MYVSNNAGTNWTAKSSPTGFTISDMAMKDQYTYYVGSKSAVQRSGHRQRRLDMAASTTTVGTSGTYVNHSSYNVASGALLAGD